MRRVFLFTGLIIVILLSGCISLQRPRMEEAHVTRVIDGDTIVTAEDETVRLLGINTPEYGERYSDAARKILAEFVLNKTVELEAGREARDQYGRKLRYVHADGVLVNEMLIRRGLAATYLLEPGDQYRKALLRAEKEARKNSRGLWAPSTVNGCIQITEFHWNPDGNDNYRLNKEYVTFQNTCDQRLDLADWSIKDSGTNQYTFSSETMRPQTTITLHTGNGQDNTTDLYWERSQAVWNNDGDALYLRDTEDLLVAHRSYAGR